MKKLLTILLSVLLTASFLSCGGGGTGSSGSATVSTSKTNVTINLGETKTVSKSSAVKSTSSIPASIASIKFTISAPDVATIVRVITLSGGTNISETFEVPSGVNRHFVAEAMDANGNVLFRGDLYADLTGATANLTIAMVSVEVIAPEFSGLSNIGLVTTTSIGLSWSAAADNVTPPDRIQYLIYISTTPGGQDFSTPNFVTIPGSTTFTVTGLHPNTTYYIVARAKDERGNIDGNTVEKSATTFEGIISATALSTSEINLSWNPVSGTDIVYFIYMATSSHGQNLAIPSFTITGATSYTVTGLNPGTTYYFIVRVKDSAGNIDQNTVEKSATTWAPPSPTPLAGPDLLPNNVVINSASAQLQSVDISNSGTAAANSSSVCIYYPFDGPAYPGCSVTSVPGLVAGASATIDLSAYFISSDPVNSGYVIWADWNNKVSESNESNNIIYYGYYNTNRPSYKNFYYCCNPMIWNPNYSMVSGPYTSGMTITFTISGGTPPYSVTSSCPSTATFNDNGAGIGGIAGDFTVNGGESNTWNVAASGGSVILTIPKGYTPPTPPYAQFCNLAATDAQGNMESVSISIYP